MSPQVVITPRLPWRGGPADFTRWRVAGVSVVFLVWRFGVLSFATFVVVRALDVAPMVPAFSAWYPHVTIMALVIVLGLTAWSFHAVLGGWRLVRQGFLES